MESDDTRQLREKVQLYEGVLNNILSGVLITDPDGYIIFFSESYGKFLGMDPKAQIGKHTTEVIENSRMHIVAQTGIPEIFHPHQIMGRNQIVQRIPIFIDGKLAAVFGQVMFEDIKDVQILADKLNILESKVQLYEKELENLRASKYSCRNIVGSSAVMQELRKLGQRAAKVNSPVLLVGESGTGKGLVARLAHRASTRADGPFIQASCAALSALRLERQLFGIEGGRGEDARGQRQGTEDEWRSGEASPVSSHGAGHLALVSPPASPPSSSLLLCREGRFDLAHGGTLLLDEVSEVPPPLQAKLLRAAEDQEFERVGGSRTLRADVRLICTTVRDLAVEVEAGRFRRDLFHRLNVLPVVLPPLRERRDDIPLLAQALLCEEYGSAGSWACRSGRVGECPRDRAGQYGSGRGQRADSPRPSSSPSSTAPPSHTPARPRPRRISPAALDALRAYPWPGNVRELRSVIHRAVLLGTSEEIGLDDLPLDIVNGRAPSFVPRSIPATLGHAPSRAEARLASSGDGPPAGDAAGEGDHVHAWMADERAAHVDPAGDDIHHAGRKARLQGHAAILEADHRRDIGGLEHHAVAGGQGGGEFLGLERDRRVPGDRKSVV